MPALSPDEIDRLARKRAGAKLGWFLHAAVYVVVNLTLLAMSRYGWGNRPWSIFPVLGWGLGLALHGLSVFVIGQGSALREHLVRKERERLQREHGGPR
ncbi:2TM domain-containing protein [Ramlibacter humi]|uniref:2TM domain-containing protein n=1 Tax=Ramlibacter humi TaxID=2530451 RepID=A0A4Z0CCR7_9BURK|nr:2TM domain-containing protein [Ramlibacter humi]TFZ08884.1 2TM domain-containing protein [Ramlibacter humi]